MNNYQLLNCGCTVCNIIGNAVNNRKQDIDINNDVCDFIKNFVAKHNIESIIGSIVEKKEGINCFDEFIENINDACFRQMKFDIMADKISEELSKSQIKHIILKGKEISKYYPDNIIRTSSDIDFYVDKKDIRNAADVIQQCGFIKDKNYTDNEYNFKKEPRYYVELHSTLEGFSKHQIETLIALTKNAECSNKYRYSLIDSDCYIHAMFHLFKHFILSGAGVRMFFDIYMIDKKAKIDYEYTDVVLNNLGILDFSKTVKKVNDILFDNAPIIDKNIEEILLFIFSSGAYGTQETNLHLSNINRDVRNISKLKVLSQNFGLSFSAMKKRYPVLKKAPYLYPFSFIYRFFYGLFFRRNKIRNEINIRNSISDERISQYENIFRNAGIIK